MDEADYLQPVGRTGSLICAVLCTLLSVAFLFFGGWMWLENLHGQKGPGWEIATGMMGVGLFVGFIAWRLAREKNSSNGVTSLPSWFLQFCGGLLLLAAVTLTYSWSAGWLSTLMIALPAGLFLMLLPRRFAKRHQQRSGKE